MPLFAIQFLFGAVVLKVQYVGHRGGMFSVANSFQSEQRADCIDIIWRFLHDNLGFLMLTASAENLRENPCWIIDDAPVVAVISV